jgi:hypothetical protein
MRRETKRLVGSDQQFAMKRSTFALRWLTSTSALTKSVRLASMCRSVPVTLVSVWHTNTMNVFALDGNCVTLFWSQCANRNLEFMQRIAHWLAERTPIEGQR